MTIVLRKLLMPIAKIYWRIFRPHTFGVKGVIPHPDDKNRLLLVRHSYGDKSLWNLPGGGYNPKRENVGSALARELSEELNLGVSNLEMLGEYKTSKEGKRDQVAVMLGYTSNSSIKYDNEICEIAWFPINEFETDGNVAKIARFGAQLYLKKLQD